MLYQEVNVCLNPYNLTYGFYCTFYSYKASVKLFYNDNFPNFVIFFRPQRMTQVDCSGVRNWPKNLVFVLCFVENYQRSTHKISAFERL